jgi:hypothetical protein
MLSAGARACLGQAVAEGGVRCLTLPLGAPTLPACCARCASSRHPSGSSLHAAMWLLLPRS